MVIWQPGVRLMTKHASTKTTLIEMENKNIGIIFTAMV
jgi:hypothetical protein